MAKKIYKIPASLEANYLDMEIAIKNSDGVGLKPLPVKVILFYVTSLMLLFWAVMNTFISDGSFRQKVIFVILWISLTFVLAAFDKTKRMQVQLLPLLTTYLPSSFRYISTRRSDKADSFYYICGFKRVTDDGLITWSDGTLGYAYRIVGSASALLFDEDRTAILNKVDSFWQKMTTDSEISFVTLKESQKVKTQLNALSRRYVKLSKQGVRNTGIDIIAQEQQRALSDHVGKTYKSIHQYLIVRGEHKEALSQAKNIIQGEADGSDLVFKQCVPLDGEETLAFMRYIYQ